MALGTFVAPTAGNFIKADKFDPRLHANKPLIVKVREFKEGFTTTAYPDPRDIVIVDLVDLSPVLKNQDADVLVSVIWGSAAMVDRLKKYAGTDEKLPLKIVQRESQQTKRTYQTVEPLDGGELTLAAKWDEKNPDAIDNMRAQRQAEADARAAEENGDKVGLSNTDQTGAPLSTMAAAAPAVSGLSDADLEAAIRNL